jgi:UDP-hydrolysing UDP-N-acetyl-D-glucosamine 2-epimerase
MTSSKRKVCVVVTARPSYSRIKTALQAIKDHSDLELQLVAAASALLDNYGKVVNNMVDDGFEIAERVFMVLEGENLVTSAKSTGLGIVELATTFNRLKPDIVVTIADRFETIATAITASYLNIPLAHVQGGEVTGSIDEKVRHAITKLADLHLVSNNKAAERVIRMGEAPDKVFVTGCPSIDIAAQVMRDDSSLNFDPFKKYGGVGDTFDFSQGYLVVMQHPVTHEFEAARKQVTETLYAIQSIGMPTFWFWPNVDAGADFTSRGIRSFREIEKPNNLHFFKNMLPDDFLRLIHNSRGIVGNSSVAIRECAYLGVPAVNIGVREAGRDRGLNVIDVDYDRAQIVDAIRKQLANGHYPQDEIYGNGTAGKQIADVLATAPLTFTKRITY